MASTAASAALGETGEFAVPVTTMTREVLQRNAALNSAGELIHEADRERRARVASAAAAAEDRDRQRRREQGNYGQHITQRLSEIQDELAYQRLDQQTVLQNVLHSHRQQEVVLEILSGLMRDFAELRVLPKSMQSDECKPRDLAFGDFGQTIETTDSVDVEIEANAELGASDNGNRRAAEVRPRAASTTMDAALFEASVTLAVSSVMQPLQEGMRRMEGAIESLTDPSALARRPLVDAKDGSQRISRNQFHDDCDVGGCSTSGEATARALRSEPPEDLLPGDNCSAPTLVDDIFDVESLQHGGNGSRVRQNGDKVASKGWKQLPNSSDGVKGDEKKLPGWFVKFDIVVTCLIAVNAICFGLQTDYMATERTETSPPAYAVLEIVFFVFFTAELGIRLCLFGWRFYTMENAMWNMFDTFLVLLQLFDVAMELVMGISDTSNLSVLRFLKFLRMLRALRLLRLLHQIEDLKIVTHAIASSIQPLLRTCMLIFIFMYMIGIVFTQAVTNHRICCMGDDSDADLEYWWGSLFRSMLSLYEAITGGADWDPMISELHRVHLFWALLFVAYIAFMVLSLFNVITGLFVQSALKNAASSVEAGHKVRLKRLFPNLDSEGNLSKAELEAQMEDGALQKFLDSIDISYEDALSLFDVYDPDASETISADEFFAGLVRLRESAKYIDLVNFFCDHSDHMRHLYGVVASVQSQVTTVRHSLGISSV
eukprot:TRINITY_DN19128_c0_g1_i2.p1 TRINITY_DN19128_c0_g1~~TRINITY_DN19128_c0_g1_i2.p1  ORF type:complete len:716 (+),score=119.73 TRINITY_DN19128_c0_g1_i2:69-2216(+)